jgi:long-chain acyl-CoA synthetase
MFNLAVMLEDSARTVPDRVAVVCGQTRMTYGEVDAAANRVANLLTARGIGQGDKVALTDPNVPYFPVVYYGVLKAGAVVVPLNVLFKSREVAYHLRDSDAQAYFCFEGTPELPMGEEGLRAFRDIEGCENFVLIEGSPGSAPSTLTGVDTLASAVASMPTSYDTVPTEATDTAVILYTSGTTGQPKGAELTHANVGFNVLTNHRLFRTEARLDRRAGLGSAGAAGRRGLAAGGRGRCGRRDRRTRAQRHEGLLQAARRDRAGFA